MISHSPLLLSTSSVWEVTTFTGDSPVHCSVALGRETDSLSPSVSASRLVSVLLQWLTWFSLSLAGPPQILYLPCVSTLFCSLQFPFFSLIEAGECGAGLSPPLDHGTVRGHIYPLSEAQVGGNLLNVLV